MSYPRKKQYRELMERIRQAHRLHADRWDATYRETKNAGTAYAAAEKEQRLLNDLLKRLFLDHLEPVMTQFRAGDPDAIDSILDFLEVDIPAFRCGYAKESFFRMLKRLHVSELQKERLRALALARCGSLEYRREDAELRRLMINLADHQFLERLTSLEESSIAKARHKCQLMRKVILGERKDLRSVTRGSTS